ncbi:hypothetical protein P168DRAFT_258616 [Aspergillus campestris IBT 28561]|uniref:Glycosyl transferase family 25 domain-containing protein n=1 Tax=Aspergillus campestris (strain IBT 28561) TaxID=1392248 RepID=A0A2I1CVY7_ASPC2|nr:uncharacterized protein P168DRAFT_258616 [Aspergillus campestris IBT 28561]PKY01789.1 hypothetical protein P168DRAFT_258616 [Aspergillus campestris IBT 28561]
MAWSIPSKRIPSLLLYLIGVVAVAFVLFAYATFPTPVPAVLHQTHPYLEDIRNETLGVEKIFAINLPSRPDKRDSIVLRSSVLGFHVDWIDGVTPDQLNALAYSYNWHDDLTAREYAARRAHVNALQHIVDEGISSAIIMEDDSDWDVTIKTQLQSVAIALQALQGTSAAATTSPYGDDWDILWLGHCGINWRSNSSYFAASHDPTVTPTHHFTPVFRESPPINRTEDTRLVFEAEDGVCSYLYAVSNSAAKKMLSALSVSPTGMKEDFDSGGQLDITLGRMCRANFLKCYAPFPSLTGRLMTSSDIKDSDESAEQGREKSRTPPGSANVVYSTLLNINRILDGESSVHATWEDFPVQEIRPGNVSVIGGTMHIPGEGEIWREVPFYPPS